MSGERGFWIATLRVALSIPGAASLKERRSVVRKLVERARSRFETAAVAEVEETEYWQRATLGVAAVSGDRAHAERMAEELTRYFELNEWAPVLDISRELRPFESGSAFEGWEEEDGA